MKRYRCSTHGTVLVEKEDELVKMLPAGAFMGRVGCYLLTATRVEEGRHGQCVIEVL